MNSSKNTFSLSLVVNIKKRIGIVLKSFFSKNKIYADASTQTENEDKNLNLNDQFYAYKYYCEVGIQKLEVNQTITKFFDDSQFNKAIESYSLLNSPNHPPLNLINGLMFQPINAECKSLSNIDSPSASLEKPILQARINRKISL